MAAPSFVPQSAATRTRTYTSPPQGPTSWRADRPGDLVGRQPDGERLGSPSPDGGYALTVVAALDPELHLQAGEHRADVHAGLAAVATKRASIFGRAPVIHDLKIAAAVWGFLTPNPPARIVEARATMFGECSHPYFYERLRDIADAVPDELLGRPTQQALDAVASDWRTGLDLG